MMRTSLLAYVLFLTMVAGGPQFENRWEGLTTEHDASSGWELRSFTASVADYPTDRGVDLTVKYYVPDATEAFLDGQEVSPLLHYLMRPQQNKLSREKGWRYFKGWPTQDVLLPRKIPSSNLGTLIWLGTRSDAVSRYAPATIYYASEPSSIQQYSLKFLSVNALRKFSYLVTGQNGYTHSYDHAATGSRSTVELNFDAMPIPQGWTNVIVSARYEDLALKATPLHIAVEFYHMPLGKPQAD